MESVSSNKQLSWLKKYKGQRVTSNKEWKTDRGEEEKFSVLPLSEYESAV